MQELVVLFRILFVDLPHGLGSYKFLFIFTDSCYSISTQHPLVDNGYVWWPGKLKLKVAAGIAGLTLLLL